MGCENSLRRTSTRAPGWSGALLRRNEHPSARGARVHHVSAVVLALLLAAPTEPPTTGALGPGEQITYKVSWLGLPAGSAEVTVGAEAVDRPGSLPIVTQARSDLVVYPLRNKIVSWWDPASGRWRGLEMYSEENRKRRRLKIDFDRNEGNADVVRQNEGEPPKESKVEVPPGAVDVATAVFFLRSQPLGVGDTVTMPIFTGAKLFKGLA